MKTVPLKRVVGINLQTLPETTEPGFEFRYVDIGAVSRGQLNSEPEASVFASAPSRARRLVRQGDTIISTVRTYLRAVWPVRDSATDLVVSTGFAVLTPTRSIDSRYLGWLVQSDVVVEEVVARSVGVSYPAINPSDIGTVRVPLPPFARQRAIADYLDRETARIDALIEKKQRLVEVLEERQSLKISELLTSTVELALSRSGPFRWSPLRFLASVHGGLTLGKSYEEVTVDRPYLRVANVQDGALELGDVATVSLPPLDARRYELQHGDLLLLEGNGNPANLGRGTIWQSELPGCLHQNHIHVVRADPRSVIAEYLNVVLRSQWARFFFTEASDVVGISTLSQDRIRDLMIPVPPIKKQMELVEAVLHETKKHSSVSGGLRKQIDLLVEHRQALITAAVTGELPVPGVAA